MRFTEWCATVLGAAALLQTAVADTTLTYTVLRANAQPTTSWGTSWSTPSAGATGYSNVTSAWGTGTAAPTWTSGTSSGAVVQATGGAARLGMDAVGLAAVAGLVGMVAF